MFKLLYHQEFTKYIIIYNFINKILFIFFGTAMQKFGKITSHVETVFFFSGCFTKINSLSYKTYHHGFKHIQCAN